MALRLVSLAIAVLAAGAGVAAVPAPLVNVTDSHVTRDIDCKGGDLAVSGNADTLTLAHCNTITVLGDSNRLSAKLLWSSSIATVGNHNVVVFEDQPGFDARVTSTGSDNEIVPRMSDRDMRPSAPFKPAGAGH